MLGLFLAFKSMRLSVWSKFGPDEGFFPLSVAIIIIGLSLTILVKSVLHTQGPKKMGITEEQGKKGETIFRVSSYAILMLVYGLLIEWLGFLMTSALFIFPIVKIVERQNWKTTLLLGFISIVISYVLFVYFLGVPLPRGFMGAWWQF